MWKLIVSDVLFYEKERDREATYIHREIPYKHTAQCLFIICILKNNVFDEFTLIFVTFSAF